MEKLERRLGLLAVIAISISAMLGSGIFVLPGIAAAKTGPSIWLAYVVAGLCVLPAALSKAELATAMPQSGGTYVYLDRTFGPLIGTVSGLGLWLSLLLKSALALLGFSAYLAVLLPSLPVIPVALVLLVLIVVLNSRGVKNVGRIQLTVVGISLCGLGALALAGFFQFEGARLTPFFSEGTGGFFTAVAFVFVSFAGVTKVAAIAEEVKQPERNLPIGILLSLAIVTFLYGGTALILVGVVPIDQLMNDERPIHTLAQTLGGIWFGIPAAILGVVTMTSMANAGLLAASRFPFAMSRDSLLPPAFSKLHPAFLTPMVAIFASGGIMAIAIMGLNLEAIAKVASVFMILIYGIECLAVVVLRESGAAWYRPSYRSPLYPWTQVFGVLASVALLVVTGPVVVVAVAAITAPGLILFFLYGRRRATRLGVVGLRGRRTDLVAEAPPSAELPTLKVEGGATVVVALFGSERSPEILVELAASLVKHERIEVVHLTEVPEQTDIDAIVTEDPKVASVRRRIEAMAEDRSLDIEFRAVATHDIVGSVAAVSEQLHCEWLFMEWVGRQGDAFTFKNPLGWLKDHLSCNLAIFNDQGVRYIRKILAYPEPGAHDALVVGLSEHLAALNKGSITFAHYVPHESEDTEQQQWRAYLRQMQRLCRVNSDVVLLDGKKKSQAFSDISSSYDLIVIAEPHVGSFWASLQRKDNDLLTEEAACSVLRVQTPQRQSHESLDLQRTSYAKDELRMLLGLIDPRAIRLKFRARSKDKVFERLAEGMAPTILEADEMTILRALKNREAQQNTILEGGVALPHATISGIRGTRIGVFTTRVPLDYDSNDRIEADVFFCVLGPPEDRETHLTALAALARLLRDSKLADSLRQSKTADDVFACFKNAIGEVENAWQRNPSQRMPRLSLVEGTDGRQVSLHLPEAGAPIVDSDTNVASESPSETGSDPVAADSVAPEAPSARSADGLNPADNRSSHESPNFDEGPPPDEDPNPDDVKPVKTGD